MSRIDDNPNDGKPPRTPPGQDAEAGDDDGLAPVDEDEDETGDEPADAIENQSGSGKMNPDKFS